MDAEEVKRRLASGNYLLVALAKKAKSDTKITQHAASLSCGTTSQTIANWMRLRSAPPQAAQIMPGKYEMIKAVDKMHAGPTQVFI